MKTIFSALVLVIAVLYGCSAKKKHLPFYSTDFNKAKIFYEQGNDSAFPLLNKIAHESEDNLQIASAYTYMGWMQEAAGDYYGCQESVLAGQPYLDSNNSSHKYWIAQDYNILGNISLNLKNYDSALSYYDRALQSDPSTASYYLNNKAVVYQKKKQYGEAISIYQSMIDQKSDSIEYAKELSNLARSKWLDNPTYDAAPELWNALNIRKIKKDTWGLNASYSHLADYYQRTRKDSALYYANQMYEVAISLSSADDQLEALDKLSQLEQPAAAVKYYSRYIQLNDSIQQARNAAKNQFVLIRFDAEKSKAANLVLQKDNADKRSKIKRQQVIVFGLSAGILCIIIIGRLLYKKREQRIILKSQHAMKEQELKTSRKVHDVVANGLYHVMTEIEHTGIEKEKLLDKIEVLYEKSRDISYEPVTITSAGYPKKINELLSSYSNATTKILIAGNSDSFWEEISSQKRNELEHVLQELMINMKKHSRANNVVVKFDHDDYRYTIKYTDDGIGSKNGIKKGNGLQNTGNRIHEIGGIINFDLQTSKGFAVTISFSNNTNDQ